MKLLLFLEPIREDMERVEKRLLRAAEVEYPLLQSAVQDLVMAGGKRLRPAVAILASQFYVPEREKVASAAAAVEMLHTATLVHDDMIDLATTRRGHPTLNSRWSNEATVLTGDYMFAVSASLAAETDSVDVVKVFSQALMTICSGELRQLFADREWPPDRGSYYRRIYNKTASLFAAAAEVGAILSSAPREQIKAIREYGRNLGLAFQIVDDVLDYTGEESELGKPVGNDLRQGIITLPALNFLEAATDSARHQQVRLAASGEPQAVEMAVEAIVAAGAADAALDEAREFARKGQESLARLPEGQSKRMLMQLAEYVVARRI